jgi:TPR repeat protein
MPAWRRTTANRSWPYLLSCAVGLAVVGVLGSNKVGPRWLWLASSLVAAAGSVMLAFGKEKVSEQRNRRAVIDSAARTPPDTPGEYPTVGEVSLHDLGVHVSLEKLGYLRRDKEHDLEQLLQAEVPVLVVGRSMAGKSRMAAEVVKRMFSDRQIVIPDPPSGLATLVQAQQLPENAVIWLNDLERYIDDPRDLQPRWLRQLTERGNVVVATMREEPYERFMPRASLASTQWELLTDFQPRPPLRLRADDMDERQRLAEETGDPRLSARVMRYGLAEALGGGPIAVELFELARNRHPYAYALMRAAGDWRLTGIGEAIPPDTAAGLVPHYVSTELLDGVHESKKKSVAWVTSLSTGRDAFRLLTTTNEGLRLFDYLTDHVAALGESIPDATWDAICAADASAAAITSTGYYARVEAEQPEIAEQLWRRAVNLGNPDALYNLGVLLAERDETNEAEQLYRRAAELGNTSAMTNLGVLLRGRGETSEAEQLYRRAAELGNTDAIYNLGLVLHGQGGTDEAEQLWRRAADLGNTPAMTGLGVLLLGRGEIDEAEQLWWRAADLGNADAITKLGLVLYKRGETDEAEQLLRQAADLGNADAVSSLGILLAERDETDEAEQPR